jgi:hypothetical protein
MPGALGYICRRFPAKKGNVPFLMKLSHAFDFMLPGEVKRSVIAYSP